MFEFITTKFTFGECMFHWLTANSISVNKFTQFAVYKWNCTCIYILNRLTHLYDFVECLFWCVEYKLDFVMFFLYMFIHTIFQIEAVSQRFSVEKVILKILAEFTGKHLCQRLFFNPNLGGIFWGPFWRVCVCVCVCVRACVCVWVGVREGVS